MSGNAGAPDLVTLSPGHRMAFASWFLLTAALGAWGFQQHAVAEGQPLTWSSAAYHAVQLFLLDGPHMAGRIPLALDLARWSAALASGWVLVMAVRRLVHRGQHVSRLRRVRDHAVVCGLDRKGVECVRFERARSVAARRDVVVIDDAPSPDLARLCREQGALVVTGAVTSPDVLAEAGLTRAASVFVLTPDDNTNCEVAVQVNRLVSEGPPRHEPLLCSVHLGSPDQRTSVQLLTQDAVDRGRVTMRFFDLFDVEARRVLLADLPLDHGGIAATEPRRAHLIILGFGQMGRALAVRAAQVGHFANAAQDPRRRLRISVVDRLSRESQRLRLFEYPQFESCCDLDLHQGELESPETLDRLQRWCSDTGAITSIAICVDDESRAALLATRMMPLVRESSARLAVRLSHRTGLHSVMELARVHGTSAAVSSFGAIADGCCHTAFESERRERLATSIHEAYLASAVTEPTAGDPSRQPWRTLREVLRESNRLQADHMEVKLRAIGCESTLASDPRAAAPPFTKAELELLARMEHDRWNAERWLGGWVYAPGEKDVDRRTSPYLVPWDAPELPESVREFDRNAVRAIPVHLERISLKIVRRP